MTRRDEGRARVYAAQQLVHAVFDNAERSGSREAVFFGARLTLPPEAKFASVDSLRRYLGQVLALPPVRERWPSLDVPLRVRERKGDRAAHYERVGGSGVIAVPDSRWAMRELVVLHELAHHIDRSGGEAHGAAFQEAYAQIAGMVMGPEAEHVLRVAFLHGGAR